MITLPVMTGYVFLGITFGLLMRNSGFDWWIPIIMSLLIYSGALEFAAVPLLGSAFDPVSAFVLGIMLSARHLFYGLSMLNRYKGIGKLKPWLIYGLTDETFSILSISDVENDKGLFYFLVTTFDCLYWNLGTAVGSLLGNIVKANIQGLDFVLTALFVVLFVEQLRNKERFKSGMIGFLISFIVLLAFGSSAFVIISMVAIVAVLLMGKKVIADE